jgi:hypothetical protein
VMDVRLANGVDAWTGTAIREGVTISAIVWRRCRYLCSKRRGGNP